MKTIYHAADSRGDANHGWLKSKHTFSFANYHNPERMGFGALRVINDDFVIAGQGFGSHSHRDMEIISIPLSGKLGHGDNIGNNGIIETGEIQVMSAGTGITHSEMNADDNEAVKFLQIWVIPNKMNVEPRYQQIRMDDLLEPNKFNQVLSPSADDAGVWIHQDAWFSMGNFDKGLTETYELKNANNGVYLFIIGGKVVVNDNILATRDGLGVSDTKNFTMDVIDDAKVLLMEVPMPQCAFNAHWH
ncbi:MULTISPECIES: pirin family protein [unclassified Psychrobacter]|uniref:pirin family protein n=1 Tax=unclassified Psychrobacter TaxID=196806 RepID=UPI0025D0BDF6|nr:MULTISPECIES: pirin family protein [unclassified Psychrobacter]